MKPVFSGSKRDQMSGNISMALSLTGKLAASVEPKKESIMTAIKRLRKIWLTMIWNSKWNVMAKAL